MHRCENSSVSNPDPTTFLSSADANLRDGLYHEYKRYGKVMAVRLAGTGPERYAVVSFKT